MENKTVYPFGQNGKLPSGYPIADDLETNSAEVALSAKQGKIIGDYLFGYYQENDISGVTISSYGLGAGTTASNKWTATGLHFVYPVTPGQKIKITVASTDTNGGFYAFLTNAYTVPSSTSDDVPYVPGTTRVWLNNGTTTKTVPAGAAYICCCPRDGNSDDSTWGLKTLVEAEIKDFFVQEGSSELMATISEAVDVENITADNYTLLSSGKWGDSAAKHKVVSVVPGEKLRIRPTGSTGGGNFYAFLTSSYSEPVSNNTDIPYVSGTSRTWRNDSNGWAEITCPATTAYLCLVTKNGDGDTTVWEVEKLVDVPIREAVEEHTIKDTDIIDNLVDGGSDVPLSAEQGKKLSEIVSDGFPLGVTKHEYNGAMVKIST